MGQHLSDDALEAEVSRLLQSWGVDHTWVSAVDSTSAEDFRVGGRHLDAKGSSKYYGSGFMSVRDLTYDDRLGEPVWYVVNDLMVISLEEIKNAINTGNTALVQLKQYWDRKMQEEIVGVRFIGTVSLEEWARASS